MGLVVAVTRTGGNSWQGVVAGSSSGVRAQLEIDATCRLAALARLILATATLPTLPLRLRLHRGSVEGVGEGVARPRLV